VTGVSIVQPGSTRLGLSPLSPQEEIEPKQRISAVTSLPGPDVAVTSRVYSEANDDLLVSLVFTATAFVSDLDGADSEVGSRMKHIKKVREMKVKNMWNMKRLKGRSTDNAWAFWYDRILTAVRQLNCSCIVTLLA
jgi:hypothetical protein